jgi:hypothetical protein
MRPSFATIHSMTPQPGYDAVGSFASEYSRMSEAELLGFAESYEKLVESAQEALRAEFARRNIEPPLIEEDIPDEVTSRRLVTVRRYRDVSEAIVARSVIQSAGIFCFLRDENLIRLDWQVSNFIGGMSLQVGPEDADEAEELLSQPIPASIEYESQTEYVQPHCPRCGSIDVAFEGADRSAALVSTMLVGLPLPLGGTSWRCHACGCRWSEDDEQSPSG